MLNHELGHAIIQHHIFKPQYGAIAECFQVFSAINIVITLLECLADLAPAVGSKQGVLTYLWTQSRDSTIKSPGLAMYFSDIWFFDTNEKELNEYSELLSIIILKSLHSTPQHSLSLFSTKGHSCLMLWVDYVYNIIDRLVDIFLSQSQKNQLFLVEDYDKKVITTQKIFEEVFKKSKDEINQFLQEQEEEVIKKCYHDLGYSAIYHHSKAIRRNQLFTKIKDVLVTLDH